jgi:hypothetical protein
MFNQSLVLLAVFVVVALGLSFTLIGSKKKTGSVGEYRNKNLMTGNEAEFFGRLVAALPDHYVFPQVAMSAILQASSNNSKQAHSDFLRIAMHRVDYLVCDTQCAIIAVVELDDRTHSAAKDALRDSRLEQAGIRTVRVQSKNKPNKEELRDLVVGDLAAKPSSSSVTRLRTIQTVSI